MAKAHNMTYRPVPFLIALGNPPGCYLQEIFNSLLDFLVERVMTSFASIHFSCNQNLMDHFFKRQ